MESEVDILLVEDTESDAEMTIRALNKGKLGYRIIHVWDGKEANDFLLGLDKYSGRDTGIKPKIILLDLKMPRLNGIDLLRLIRSNTITRNIPVVVLTSSKEDPDMKQCYDLGVNSYIVKPVGYDDFTRVVGELGMYWMLYNQIPPQL